MRKTRLISAMIAVVMVMLLVLSGCNNTTPSNTASTQPSTGASTPASAPASAKPAGEVVIGYVGPQTGNSASMGNATIQGAELAIEEINKAGGILGSTIKFVKRDDAADPTTSKTMTEELIDKEKVKMLIGQPNSTCVLAAEPYVNQNKVIDIVNIATNTTIIDVAKYPYTFRTFFPSPIQADALANMAKVNGFQKIVLLGDNSALGTEGIASLKKACDAAGVKYAEPIQYTANDADMTPVAEKIKAAGADCALAWTLGADGAKIVAALSRIGYMDKLIYLGYTGLTLPNFRELAGNGVDRCFTLGGSWSVDASATELDPARQALYDKIVAKYGKYGTGAGARSTAVHMIASGYDAVYMYKWAVEKAGSFDPDKVKGVLETNISEFKCVAQTDTLKFSATNHEGIAGTDLKAVTIDKMANTAKLFGDIYVRGSFKK